MRLVICHQNQETVYDSSQNSVVVGRPRQGSDARPDLDLSPDQTVSRPHARLFQDGEKLFVEDLGSTHGTQLNGDEIQGGGARALSSGDCVQLGETTIYVERKTASTRAVAPDESPSQQRSSSDFFARARGEYSAPIVPAGASVEREGRFTVVLDAGNESAASALRVPLGAPQNEEAARHLALLHELLLQCGGTKNLDALFQSVVERLVEAIGAASRGALLLRGRETGALLLKAFRSAQGPVLSETLARRAMNEGVGFIWRRGDEKTDGSIAQYRIESGMYAPLMWGGEALGVVCVDNPESAREFTPDDLRLLIAVSHYLAMALSHEHLQEELKRETATKANLLRHFSPQIAEQILHGGSLQLSGERSEVTILCSDIRGFAKLTANMEPIDVVEMLNDYFSRLIPIIFAHGGTVDKYIGDAILAVFGSPKKDPQQHENALRAALKMQEEMEKSNAARAGKGKTTCQIGIGVHSGEVLHGFIGAVDRMELTVIGDAVNRATRFCDGARGGEVIISPQLYQWVWKLAEVEATTVNTKHGENFAAFRLLDVKPPAGEIVASEENGAP